MRLSGTIQVDADDLWVLLERRGHKVADDHYAGFQKAVRNYLEIFDRYKIKVTFFVTGKDALSAKEIFKEIAARGHEIANHSANHRPRFTALSRKEKETEIREAEAGIEEATGERPVGFRSPNFDIDIETLEILQERKYLYDSSVLPTFLSPLFRRMIRFFDGKVISDNGYLGRARYGLAPLKPYHPDRHMVWKEGKSGIWEVPISTIPVFRIPFHSSFSSFASIAGFRTSFFQLGLFLSKLAAIPLNYVFHLCELADFEKAQGLLPLPELRLSFKTRHKMIDFMLDKITQNYEILPTRQFVLRYAG